MKILIIMLLVSISNLSFAGTDKIVELQRTIEEFSKFTHNGDPECEEENLLAGMVVENLPAPGGPKKSPHWMYSGPLPKLVGKKKVTISLKSHTLRITGYLPEDFDGELPDYVFVEEINGKRRVHIVYPIATGAHDENNAPGEYFDVRAMPYTPYNVSQNEVPWGGFPFIMYNRQRSIAFHGPITSRGNEWSLRRGPVSHGCNRMQGEHVVELAHLIGMDMSQPNKIRGEDILLHTEVIEDFDVIPNGQLAGKVVDVDYPSLDSVERPNENVHLFTTWDGLKTDYVTHDYVAPEPIIEVKFEEINHGYGRHTFNTKIAGADKIELWVNGLSTPLHITNDEVVNFYYHFSNPGNRTMTVKGYKDGELIGEDSFEFKVASTVVQTSRVKAE